MRKFVSTAISIVFGLILGMVFMHCYYSTYPDVVTEYRTKVDTISYHVPIPVDSIVVRYKTVSLPIATDTIAVGNDTVRITETDTISVIIPMERKVWEDSLYRIQAIGYMMDIEQVDIFQRKEIITKIEKSHRWHVGVSAGYGYTPKGFKPYIGVGLTYSILSF